MRNSFANKFLTFLIVTAFCACMPFGKAKKPSSKKDTAEILMQSVVRLGVQLPDEEEPYDMCGATAISKDGDNYEFLTASHCVSVYDPIHKKTAPLTDFVPLKFVLVFEGVDDQKPEVVDAELVAFGDRSKFIDFAVLTAKIDRDLPIPPIFQGAPTFNIKDELGIVVAPLPKMGNLYLSAYVSKPKIVADYEFDGINHKGGIPIQVIGLGVGRGSSGSAILDVKRNAIVGVMSFTSWNDQGHVTLSFCPIDRFHPFYSNYKQGLLKIPKTDNANAACDASMAKACLFFLRKNHMRIIYE